MEIMPIHETTIERCGEEIKLNVTYWYEPPQHGDLFTEHIPETVSIDLAVLDGTNEEVCLSYDEMATISDEILNWLRGGE